jgi:hypothetical protein
MVKIFSCTPRAALIAGAILWASSTLCHAQTPGVDWGTPLASAPAPVPPSSLTTPVDEKVVSVLTNTVYSAGGSPTIVPAGFTAIDVPKILNCSGPSTCRIEADQNLQLGGGPSGGVNRWAICTKVDGAYVTKPLCPFLGVVNPSNYQAGSFIQEEAELAAGAHTVQSFVYTDAGATIYLFSFVYRIYQIEKP